MRKLFGTDGIRGKANSGYLTAETALKLGMAAGSLFKRGDHRHIVVIGKDTRLSGYLLEPALTAGFIAVGMDVLLVGPMPTPAVAMLTKSMRADIGIMISASHNLYDDNGIKIFDPDGGKLSDEIEMKIEERIFTNNFSSYLASSEELGRARRIEDAPGRYIEFIKNTFPKGLTLEGVKIIIDCANGAAYHLGKTIFKELGANVEAIGVNPDGFNINADCGSTSPAQLIKAVLDKGADIGIALDGDADRLLIVDEKGKVIDGDQVIAAVAKYLKDNNKLSSNKLVVTHMSNMGIEIFARSEGIKLIRTDIGDRYVAKAMRECGANLGGEQSGHVILSDYITTGDGLVTALQILAVACLNKQPISVICNKFTPYPQILKNVPCSKKISMTDERLVTQIDELRKQHGGRILVRKSGTENLIRIMVEMEDFAKAEKITAQIVSFIEEYY